MAEELPLAVLGVVGGGGRGRRALRRFEFRGRRRLWRASFGDQQVDLREDEVVVGARAERARIFPEHRDAPPAEGGECRRDRVRLRRGENARLR